MSDQNSKIDLFALGQQHFAAFIKEFASYGVAADPDLELLPGTGLLCYYSLEDRRIYLSVPDFNNPLGKLQLLFLRSLLGCESDEELLSFFRLFIPHVIAHELAHHFRHRYGLFDQDSLWHEEQIANKLSVAVVKHRLSPQEKQSARTFLRRAIEALSTQMEEKNIATDSYHSVLHALDVSGQIDASDFERLELIQTATGISAEDMLKGSGQLSGDLLERLENRDDLIDEIDEQYASDQIKYIYYHVGWLYLDLTSRETEYVDEFARNYLNLGVDLLPLIQPDDNPSEIAVQTCYRAYQDTALASRVASRYFYKRYRSLLLARLQSVELLVPGQSQRLRREARLILENWSEGQSDTLVYLSQMASPALRPLFPHLIADHIDPQLDLSANLPAETDRRLWQHLSLNIRDEAAANTLYRLELLDQTDIYRPLPAELLLALAHLFCLARFEPGETVIWENERNDDVYFLIEGQLEVLVSEAGTAVRVGTIEPGQMFGELAFFTEDRRVATVRARMPAQCFVLTDADLQLTAYQHPTILMQMAGALAKRLADTYDTFRHETT
jgi:hypothetical protein